LAGPLVIKRSKNWRKSDAGQGPEQEVFRPARPIRRGLAAGDIEKAVECFQEDCYWRDLVAFTWNVKTMEGRDQVRDMLEPIVGDKANELTLLKGEDAGKRWPARRDQLRNQRRSRLRPYQAKDGKIWTPLTTMVELKVMRSRPVSTARSEPAWRGQEPADMEGGAREGSGRARFYPPALHAHRRRRPGRHRARRAAQATRRVDHHR
jgi:hypothetical protein